MKLTPLFLAGSLAAVLSVAAGPVAAQTAAPAAKPAPTKPAAKTDKAAPAKSAGAKSSRKTAAKTPPPPPPMPEANEEQLEAAKQAYLGDYDCEFKQTVHIAPNLKHAGYIDVAFKKDVLTMKPVLSSTGALRLEDVTGRTLMVQIANKSMLLDVKAGQRLVDECVHPEQRAAIEAMRSASAPAGPGLGISAGPSGK